LRYLITGGAGFIGSHVADRLVGRGDTVSLLDDLSTGSTANIQHLLSGPSSAAVRFTEGSVLDHSLVSQLTREVDVIVHLAATVGVELVGGAGPILARAFGFVALTFAAVNIFGGFLVTQRMLSMYRKKKR